MKKRKISVIGNLGNIGNENNGQTIKTKTIIRAINEKYGEDTVVVADTNRVTNSYIHIIKSVLKATMESDIIVLAVCDFAIKFLAFPLYIIAKIQAKKIVYVLIGGWLGKFVDKHKISDWALKRYDSIFAETKATGELLEKKNFINISYINNCKYLSTQPISTQTTDNKINLCILSRIVPEKGIEEAVKAVSMLNRNKNGLSYTLDLYGEISDDYKSTFTNLINGMKNNVVYKGVVEFQDCPKVISRYDALLFPTRVMTEGIPGTIIDSMFAGTPVIATKWNACKEILVQNYNGIYYVGDERVLYSVLDEENIKMKLAEMRKNCIKTANRFRPEVALKPLFDLYERGI